MTLSDDALKSALHERVRVVDAAGPALEPPAEIARRVAAGGRTTLRDRWIGRPVAMVAGLVATAAVVVIGSFLVARPPAGSMATIPPGASTSAVVSTPSVGPSDSIERSTTPSRSNLAVGCDVLRFDARRCAAIVARAREQVTSQGDIVGVAVEAPDRSQGFSLGGGAPIATVVFILDGGLHQRVDVSCGHFFEGVSADRACASDPQISIYGGVSHDTPCGPTPGDANHRCATPPPSPRPAVVAASTPLVLRVLDVPIDHVGHYEVLAGVAWLPDGLLSERSASIGDPRPTTYWIDDGIAIEVRPGPDPCSAECPRPIDSIYHQPFHGPQQVHVYLAFDVVELTAPGSILEVRNLVVR
jgi:hypothetical protein